MNIIPIDNLSFSLTLMSNNKICITCKRIRLQYPVPSCTSFGRNVLNKILLLLLIIYLVVHFYRINS